MTSKEDEKTHLEHFPKLPIEVRHKIWKAVCYIPRNVGIDAECLGGSDGDDYLGQHEFRCAVFNSFNGVPAILHVSQEARTEGLKYYTLEFGDKAKGKIGRAVVRIFVERHIYVNFDVDTLCLLPFNDWERSYSPGFEFLDRLQQLVRRRRGQLLDSVAVPVEFIKRCLDAHDGGWLDYEYHPEKVDKLNSLIRSELLIYSTAEGPLGARSIRFSPWSPEHDRTLEGYALTNAMSLAKTRDMELQRREKQERILSQRNQTPPRLPDLKIVYMEFVRG